MNWSATHFTPTPQALTRDAGVNAPTVLSISALAGISAFVRQAFGPKVLRQANDAAMLDIELIEEQDGFIPHTTMTRFLAEIERRSGEQHLGLLFAPYLSLARYGRLGDYILAADTLGAALSRTLSAAPYHSRGDRVMASADRGIASVSYLSAARGEAGYAHVACGSAGVLLSLLRFYLPPDWRPLRIELDIERPRSATPFEDAFGCPVTFDAEAVSVVFDARLLHRNALPRSRARLLTLEDVARSRAEPERLDRFLGVAIEQIRVQVLAGAVSIDNTARALDTSVRTLQRFLSSEGTDFRQQVNALRAQRAQELLGGSAASVTEIAAALGYSTPANFARAFRKATGTGPQEFRARRWSSTQ